jgi:cbb3-type cytochrome oxidase maturation protein
MDGKKRKIIMSVMYVLIGISLMLALGFLGLFIWNVRSGQMDDDYTPSVRILFEDTPKSEIINEEKTDKNHVEE